MLLRLSLLFEILSVVVCIHRLYNRKMKFDVSAIVVILGYVAIFDVINIYGMNSSFTLLAYELVGGYCIYRFGDSILGAIISVFLAMAFLVVIQFLLTLPLHFLIRLKGTERELVTNILLLAACMWILPRFEVDVLRRMVKKYKGALLLAIVVIWGIIIFLQSRQRSQGIIRLDIFLPAILIIILIITMIRKLGIAQTEKQEVEEELHVTQTMQEKQKELMKEVRLRQHEFKNHLAAILATHYTYKSYENLVTAQREYYGELIQENKYNDLLVLDNTVLIGFLYEKFQKIEADNVKVEYKVKGKLPSGLIPAHYLIEIIGILLDNAVQAVQSDAGKPIIRFAFDEIEEKYRFKVSNPFQYVGYDEMQRWFQMGKSTKGEGRGLGLYRVRGLCKEQNCGIICKNVNIENENWIEFCIEIKKAD